MWGSYYTPTCIEDALHLLAEHGDSARIIAGGTDLLVELRRDPRPDLALVDVTRIGGLDRLWLDGRGLVHIGPTVTHNQAVASGLLMQRGFSLALSCWQVGTPQLRNRGTIAGNLVTASPANDTITALWALDARLTLQSVGGERTVVFDDFYRGVRRTVLATDEMVTDIAFPALSADQRGIFCKLGLRRTHAIAVVNVAVLLTFDSDRVVGARVTLGSVAPTIVRASEAEKALVGGALEEQHIAEAAALAAQAASPIDDIRAGADYRRHAVCVLVRRALVALRDGTERSGLLDRSPRLWGKTDGHFQPAPASGGMMCHQDQGTETIVCTVNGREVTVRGAGGKTLLQMLREDLGLTGTKEGCGEGECGACTVWMDGMAVLACLVPAPRAHGTRIVTVEGLAAEREATGTAALHPVQQAFVDEGAVQCGFCTPGFVMSSASLLEEIPRPTREQIMAGLSGNLCRCTGYYKIVRAIERAANGMLAGR
jgi:xanthine dehydrogenase iron-sulfur cluster and FAD-binding subunit A